MRIEYGLHVEERERLEFDWSWHVEWSDTLGGSLRVDVREFFHSFRLLSGLA